ncbi:MAG: hypothetical protein ACXACX_21960 [Candidatus Hodarchaeales archaeon]|jgi:hypothetical protein
MGINIKNEAKEKVKDDKEIVKNDEDKEISKEVSKREIENDSKNDIRPTNDIKENNKQKNENEWDKIDWNKDISEKKSANTWDKIDWNKDNSEKKSTSIWDEIEWDKDISQKRNNIELDYVKSEKDSVKESKDYHHKNLLDPKIKDTFITYNNETGKYPNYGKNIRKDFIDWAKKSIKDPEIISMIEDINKSQGISNFIKDRIENSDSSQTQISNRLKEMGLSVSRKTVGNISLKEVFNDNEDAHHQRFDISLAPEIREKISIRINEELEKYTSDIQHDSLYKIAKDFPEISEKTLHKIAKNEIPKELYRNMWPSTSGTVSTATKNEIELRLNDEVQKKNPNSLRSISNDIPGASQSYVRELAKKLYPTDYKELWPAIKKLPDEIKNDILKTIKDESLKEHPRTLRDIHKDFPEVGADTIKRLAKQNISKDLHDKIWAPLAIEIPNELAIRITKTIKNEINKPDPRSLNEIGRQFNVSTEYIRKMAKKNISKEDYENTWKAYESITKTTRINIINDIMNTKLNISEIADKNNISSPSVSNISQRDVFQDNISLHRERFPIDQNLEIGSFTHLNINSLITRTVNKLPNQKYFAEPNIYSDKRRPDGLILEDNKFMHKRMLNPQNGEYLRECLEINYKDLESIESIQFDFTNDIRDENIIHKINKYQSENTLLFIVGTRWYFYDEIKHLPQDNKIKYPENVRVISHNLSADLIGLKGEDKALYDKIIELNYDRDLDSLKALYNYDLSSINTHNTQELKEDLIQKGLIKENFNEYFSFDEFNEKDPKEKQLDLDHFLNC